MNTAINTFKGQFNGLGRFKLVVNIKIKGFYFGDDSYDTRKPIAKECETESNIERIFEAVDLRLKRINLKVRRNWLFVIQIVPSSIIT